MAAVTTGAEQLMPALLSRFRQHHPQVGVLLEAGNRDRVFGLLDARQVDLGLGGRPEPHREARVQAVRPHQLLVVSAPEVAARAPRTGLPAWLAGQTWLLREPGSGTRVATESLLAELDIAPLTLTVGSNVAIRESARVGLGITLISGDAAEPERQRPAGGPAGAGHAAAPELVPHLAARRAGPAGAVARQRGSASWLPPPRFITFTLAFVAKD